jgi:hypothetical protein
MSAWEGQSLDWRRRYSHSWLCCAAFEFVFEFTFEFVAASFSWAPLQFFFDFVNRSVARFTRSTATAKA